MDNAQKWLFALIPLSADLIRDFEVDVAENEIAVAVLNNEGEKSVQFGHSPMRGAV